MRAPPMATTARNGSPAACSWARARGFMAPSDFRGHVDNRLHVDNGYKGKLPERGEKAEPSNRLDKNDNFKGNETRDGRGIQKPRAER